MGEITRDCIDKWLDEKDKKNVFIYKRIKKLKKICNQVKISK